MSFEEHGQPKGPFLLWVDDEPQRLTHTADQLRDFIPGIEVEFASSISVALKKLAERTYHLLLLDIYNIPLGRRVDNVKGLRSQLTKENDRIGLAFCQTLRKGLLNELLKRDVSTIPVIVTSGFPYRAMVSQDDPLDLTEVSFVSKADFIGNPSLLADLIVEATHVERVTDLDDKPSSPTTSTQDSSGLRRIVLGLAQILHDNILELLAARSAVKNVLSFFGASEPGAGMGGMNVDTISLLEQPATVLLQRATRLTDLISIGDSTSAGSIGTIDIVEKLRELATETRALDGTILPSNLRELAALTTELQVKAVSLPPEIAKSVAEIVVAARDVQQVLCQYDLHHLAVRIEEMIQQSELLSAYLSSSRAIAVASRQFSSLLLLERAVAATQPYAHAKGVEVHLEPPKVDFILNGDLSALTRALKNLVFNGIKYSYSMSKNRLPWVTVSQVQDDEYARILVENWGVPILPHEIQSGLIFQEGYRGERAREHARTGHGMGLADASTIVKQHEGEILVSSVPAKEKLESRGRGPNINTFEIRMRYMSVTLSARNA